MPYVWSRYYHDKLIDGLVNWRSITAYLPFDTFCGVCDKPFSLSPRTQKYMLEVKSIPVKMLRRGAVYCVKCRRRRSRINWLKSADKWRTEPHGKEELNDLLEEERNLKSRSRHRYKIATWPYGSKLGGLIERFVSRRRTVKRSRREKG
jgi:hypothetical protein